MKQNHPDSTISPKDSTIGASRTSITEYINPQPAEEYLPIKTLPGTDSNQLLIGKKRTFTQRSPQGQSFSINEGQDQQQLVKAASVSSPSSDTVLCKGL